MSVTVLSGAPSKPKKTGKLVSVNKVQCVTLTICPIASGNQKVHELAELASI